MTALLRAPPEAKLLDLQLAPPEPVQNVGGGLENPILVVHPPGPTEARESPHAIPAAVEAGRGLPQRRIRDTGVAPDVDHGDVRHQIEARSNVPTDRRPLRDDVHPEVVLLHRHHHVGGAGLGGVLELHDGLTRRTGATAGTDDPIAVLVDAVADHLHRAGVDPRISVVAVDLRRGRGQVRGQPAVAAGADDGIREGVAVLVQVPVGEDVRGRIRVVAVGTVGHEAGGIGVAGENLLRLRTVAVAISVLVERDVEAVVGHAVAVLVDPVADLGRRHTGRRTGVPGGDRPRVGGRAGGPGTARGSRRRRGVTGRRHRIGIDVGVDVRIGIRVGVRVAGRRGRGGHRRVVGQPGGVASSQQGRETQEQDAHWSTSGLIV